MSFDKLTKHQPSVAHLHCTVYNTFVLGHYLCNSKVKLDSIYVEKTENPLSLKSKFYAAMDNCGTST